VQKLTSLPFQVRADRRERARARARERDRERASERETERESESESESERRGLPDLPLSSPSLLTIHTPPSPSPPPLLQSCKHHVSSIDAQPSVAGGILVFVTGQLLPEGEANALKFSQAFHLAPLGGSFVVTNDLFRLNYA